MFLRELRQPISSLKGAGPRVEAMLSQLGVLTVADLLLLSPRDYDDRTKLAPLSEFATAPKVNAAVTVLGHEWFGYGRMKTLKVLIEDGTAQAWLICFNRPFLEKQLVKGERYFVSGAFQYRFGEIQSSSFDFEPLGEDPGDGEPGGASQAKLLPVYPLTAGLSQAVVRKLEARALAEYGRHVESDLPDGLLGRYGLLPCAQALKALHAPEKSGDIPQARKSLAFAELFYLELMIGRRALKRKQIQVPRAIAPDGRLKRLLMERLPFSLTEDQLSCLAEIESDMAGPWPMARLLQGDVGSGKTLVAFFACLRAVESGGQAAIMAPTELLARQHADTAARLLEPLGVRLAFLSGNVKDSGRRPLLEALAKGEIDIAIGTHALFSKDVEYRCLSLAVIDEQHRFGVMQRVALSAKSREPDLLMMTATPIPRTLALTEFGDLAVSTIRSLPKGRLPVKTHMAAHGNEKKVYDFVRREVESGRQAYFVYPLIESSEKLDLKNAQDMFEQLKTKAFKGVPTGIIHSRLPEEEKRSTMLAFSRGEIKILVATSVVEVGVDVPNASCMVIEHAERFGLSALHQLRGRVGRGEAQSYAFLVYSKELTADAKERLKAIMESADGFRISEEDLRIRGPGEVAGTAQSGQLKLAFADLVRDGELLERARAEAFSVLETDPGFLAPENAVFREVLNRAPPFSESIAARG
jgi:ATP-dependent DNA helicase RecG